MAQQKPTTGGIDMTNLEAVARQAAYENLTHLRQNTVTSVQDVLKRIESVHTLTPREIGRLQWDAFAALTCVQVDMKLGAQP